MNEVSAIAAIGETNAIGNSAQVTITQMPHQIASQQAEATGDFGSLMTEAVASLDSKVAHADHMVSQFAIDESTPIHHVTIALEEARLAVELATQVRQRLTEGYRQIMNMQL